MKDWPVKFDVIVMNPPYQLQDPDRENPNVKNQTMNIWPKFISAAFKMLKPGGVIAAITPTGWTTPSGNLKGDYKIDGEGRLADVFAKYKTYADVRNVAQHFPKIGSTFGYVVIDTSKKGGITFSNEEDTKFFSEYGFLPKSGLKEVRHQLSRKNNLGKFFEMRRGAYKSGKPSYDGWRVSLPISRSLTPDNIVVLKD